MAADARFWDDIAEKYAAKPVENVPAYHRKLEITKARLRRDQTLLDVGCGTGSLALELAPHVEHVHAVDISGEMIRIARQRADAANARNVTFHQTSLAALPPFEPGAFDGVCAYNILHLVDDRAGKLKALYELLAPGGFLISSTVCLGDSYKPYGLILTVMRWLGRAPKVHIVRGEALMAEMREAGFVDVAAHEVDAAEITSFVVARKPLEVESIREA